MKNKMNLHNSSQNYTVCKIAQSDNKRGQNGEIFPKKIFSKHHWDAEYEYLKNLFNEKTEPLNQQPFYH